MSTGESSETTGKRPNIVLLVALTGIGPLATHIFVPALPDAARDLGVTSGTIQLTITAFLVGIATGQLIYGPLSDRFGRKPVLLCGFIFYLVATVFAAISWTLDMLIIARVLQALGGCSGLVLGRAIVRDSAAPDKAAALMATMNFGLSLAPAIAPAIGGLLTAWFGWRGVLGALAIAIAILIGLAVFVLAETNQTRTQWAGIAPMLRSYSQLVAMASFRAFTICGAACTASAYAFFSASPFIFGQMLGRPIEEFGFYYFVLVGGFALGSVLAQRLARRSQSRTAILIGVSLCIAGATGLMVVHLSGALSVVTILGTMFIFATGGGLVGPHASVGAMNAAPRAIGAAAGLYGFWQMAFGAICTLVVSFWDDGTILPLATVLVTSSLTGLLVMLHGTRAPRAGA
ncbi:MAG: multidrug effflux MFS transporter [Alphaproteobacteria bacterium]